MHHALRDHSLLTQLDLGIESVPNAAASQVKPDA